MKRYLNLNGISWVLDGDTDRAMSVRPLAQKMMHVMKMQNVNNLDHVWYTHRMEDGTVIRVESLFGRDRAYVYCEPTMPVEKGRIEKKLTEYILPAIEAYDINGGFVGLVICLSGTFEPPYEFLPIDSYDKIYPFKYGQWRWWYDSKPFEGEMVRKTIYYGGNNKNTKKIEDIPSTGEYLAAMESDVDEYEIDIRERVGEYTLHEDTLDCCSSTKELGFSFDAWGSYFISIPVTIDVQYGGKYRMSVADENNNATSNFLIQENTFAEWWEKYINDNCYNVRQFSSSCYGESCDCDVIYYRLTEDYPHSDYWAGDFSYLWLHPYPTRIPEIISAYSSITGNGAYYWQTDKICFDPDWYNLPCSAIENNEKGALFGGFYIMDYIYTVTVEDISSSLGACERLLSNSFSQEDSTADNSSWAEGVIVDNTYYQYTRQKVTPDYDIAEYGYLNYEDYIDFPFIRYWNIPEGVYAAVSGLRYTTEKTSYFFVNHNKGELTVTDFDKDGNFQSSTATAQGNAVRHKISGFDDIYGNGCFRILKIVEEKEVIE